MNWVVLAILSGLFFALARVAARFVLRKESDPLAFTAVHDFVAGLVLLPIIFIDFHLPQNKITWLFFLGVVVFAFLADWITFLVLKILDVSIYQIVNQIRHIFVLFGGLLLFAEPITQGKIFAVILISIGVIVTLYEKSKFNWSKGVWFTILSSLMAVIAFIFVKFAVTDFSETALASFELIAVGFLSFGLLGFNPSRIKREFEINRWGILLAGGLFGFFELFLFLALKIGEISKVIPVTQISLVFAVLAGMIILKERERIPQKIIGMILILLGIAFMNFI